ncbi:MAG: acyl carrier protein [Alphaproteobacteria bacterium]|nr:acyl carrier protein [Alphaproteobacteria bacterium]
MSLEKLTRIFQEVFEEPSLVLSPELDAKAVRNWDSFNHINLMIALEGEFEVVLNPAEVQQIKSVGDLVDLLKAKGIDIAW